MHVVLAVGLLLPTAHAVAGHLRIAVPQPGGRRAVHAALVRRDPVEVAYRRGSSLGPT